MNLRTRILGILATAALSATLGAAAPPTPAPAPVPTDPPALTVAPHHGSQAIDISGHTAPGSLMTISLFATFSRDLPDVLLTRKFAVANPDGVYMTTVSIAPGYFSGALITVYVKPPADKPVLKATYTANAPNDGVELPADQVPKSVR